MKKLISFLLSAFLLFTVCFVGCNGNSDEIYIGEGKMTVIRSLISSNGFLANEVFGAKHLPVDSSKAIVRDSHTYAPVVSDRITDYSSLESLVKSTYTEDIAQKLLNEPKKYTEIDGVLYFDMQYSFDEEPEHDWSVFETEFKKVNDDGSYLFKVRLKKTNGFSSSVKISVSDADGIIRLCDFYR